MNDWGMLGQRLWSHLTRLLMGIPDEGQGVSPEFRRLIVGSVLTNLGIAFLWPLVAIYVHRVLGQPMSIVGVVMMAQAGAGVVGSLAGGLLYDAMGARRPMLWAVGGAVLMLAMLTLYRQFWVFAVGVTLVSFSINLCMPIFNAISVQTWPQGGRSAFNAVYVAANVGVAIGSSLGGLLASISFRIAFGAAASVMASVWFLVLATYRGPHWNRAPKKHETGRIGPRVPILRLVGWPALILASALAMQWMAYDQWEVTVPNFMAARGIPLALYSLLWTINTVLILTAQPILSKMVSRLPRVFTQLMIGTGFFLLAFFTLSLFHRYLAYVLAMLLATLGEMLVLPGVPAEAEFRSTPERRGLVQGVVSTGAALGRMLGPLAGGFLYVNTNPGRLFLVMGLAMVMGGAGYVFGEWLWIRRAPWAGET